MVQLLTSCYSKYRRAWRRCSTLADSSSVSPLGRQKFRSERLRQHAAIDVLWDSQAKKMEKGRSEVDEFCVLDFHSFPQGRPRRKQNPLETMRDRKSVVQGKSVD